MSRARIVLVTPPYDRIAPGYEFVKHVANQSPSLGLLHLAAEVREHDYEPSIIESDVFGLDAKTLRDGCRSKSVSQPRMLAMWLARKYTRAAFSEISHFFGRRSCRFRLIFFSLRGCL